MANLKNIFCSIRFPAEQNSYEGMSWWPDGLIISSILAIYNKINRINDLSK